MCTVLVALKIIPAHLFMRIISRISFLTFQMRVLLRQKCIKRLILRNGERPEKRVLVRLGQPENYSAKSRSLIERLGWRNFIRALDSICRARSRVKPNSRPTSSNVRVRPSISPNRS